MKKKVIPPNNKEFLDKLLELINMDRDLPIRYLRLEWGYDRVITVDVEYIAYEEIPDEV